MQYLRHNQSGSVVLCNIPPVNPTRTSDLVSNMSCASVRIFSTERHGQHHSYFTATMVYVEVYFGSSNCAK